MCWQAAKNKSVNIQIKCTHTFATTSQSNLYLKKKALKQGKSHKKKRIDKLKQKVGQTLHTHKIVKKTYWENGLPFLNTWPITKTFSSRKVLISG